jgi:hypothetical protein
MTAAPTPQAVMVDLLDAIECAELCDYLIEWFATAPAAVGDALARFGGENAAPIEICQSLARFAGQLRSAPTVPAGPR